MNKKAKIKTKKKVVKPVRKIVKTGRPKKNKIGQVLDPKTEKFRTGRPAVIDNGVLLKLETAFGYGCTDEEACAFADISLATLYKFQKKNSEFSERKCRLKQLPNLQARKVVVESMKLNPGIGQWWLERKLPNEFKRRDTPTSAVFNNINNSNSIEQLKDDELDEFIS